MNPIGGGSGGDALVVRTLARQVTEQQQEMQRLAAQLVAAKAVENAAREGTRAPALLAGPRALLKAEEDARLAVAATRASFAPGPAAAGLA